MAEPSDLKRHKEWLGYLQPVGVVVSPAALLSKGVLVNENVAARHQQFCDFIEKVDLSDDRAEIAVIPDFISCASTVLDWDMERGLVGYAADRPVPDNLRVRLEEYGETLEPTYALPSKQRAEGRGGDWLLLVRVEQNGVDLDEPTAAHDRGWHASPQAKFERLLRETGVPTGLLFNGTQFRLVYAPAKESSGHLTFPVSFMSEVAGRPIFAAFLILLEWDRLVNRGDDDNLPALLALSRKFQADVSTALSEQVLAGLYELLRGLQAADARTEMKLLEDVLKRAPNEVYEGLLTVLLRLIFVLYAEDRGLMPRDAVYAQHYSITGLFERLREDDARNPDTMDQRYGAWAQLLALFRIVYLGARHGTFRLPARRGFLFDPDRYPFLEGRSMRKAQLTEELPAISDGVVFRVLQKLLLLKGERLSYRSLDVEEIGSVYERMMGFNLEVAQGPTIAIKPAKTHGAPSAVNLTELLKEAPEKRAKWLRERTDQSIDGAALAALEEATSPEEAVAALDKKVARAATPGIVPSKAMVLQPSDERRRSGTHYTPRSFTAPIVQRALEPVLKRLGDRPAPEQILELKVCDPAMGSGAFLVEVARQLGEVLVRSWHLHNQVPRVPPDEDEVLHAKRLVAQRCLYGVDRNPVATDLAKLSLWLETLARDHDFTFLDHALKHGDSLIGLSREQIASFHWEPSNQNDLLKQEVEKRLKEAFRFRSGIRAAAESESEANLRILLDKSESSLAQARVVGDAVVSAFFSGDSPKIRQSRRTTLWNDVRAWLDNGRGQESLVREGMSLREGRVFAFHWPLEFPEVFSRENGGFDVIVGNPPFAGKNTLIHGNHDAFPDWLKAIHPDSHGNADLVAHFFRRAFSLVRAEGTFGLIATKTICQGDTRSTGLRWICQHGGEIFAAQRRVTWPGFAAVVVSVLHVMKGAFLGPKWLDDRRVETITAFLFHSGGHDEPARLAANAGKSFKGSVVLGTGFTFDDTDTNGVATSLAEMRRLIEKDPRSGDVIVPYIGGAEVNTSPTQAHHRFVISFGERSEEECRQSWPDLMAIVESKVKPERLQNKREIRKRHWWRFGETTPALYTAIAGLQRVLVIPQTSNVQALTFLPAAMVFDQTLIVFPFTSYSAFAVLQSRPHNIWSTFLGPTIKDDLRYAPSDCFETFPFPANGESQLALEDAGRIYYAFRAALMVKNDEGLTKTYNRFHDPDELDPDIAKLRAQQATMDRAVLDAYGWSDITTDCEFLLDYQIDEEEWGDKKRPYRYRWPDPVRDEVLARLLELNAERARTEAAFGAKSARAQVKKEQRGNKASSKSREGDLFAGL